MRYKITIEYDGTNLVGWQKQQEGKSAQEYLETALFNFTHQKSEIYAAGRTDAGVHALAQVAHFDLNTDMELFRIREAFNANLRDMAAPVAVINVEHVPDDFHARFSATGRGYIYRILNRRARTVLLENRVWHVGYPLNVDLMREGAKHLLGHHDFSSFRGAGCQALSPLKTLDKLEIIQEPLIKFMSNLSGLKVKEIEDLPPADFIDMAITIIKMPEFVDFIKVVLKSLN